MLKQNVFSSCAGTVAALMLGTVFSTTLFAADSTQRGAASKIDPAALHKALAARQAFMAAHRIPKSLGATPKEQFANPSPAYPPSCLNNGLLPNGTPGLAYGADTDSAPFQVTLPTFNNATEIDTFTVWRVPCSGGVSATLLEMDRPNSASTTDFPMFPNISVIQNSNQIFPRLPQDPDTLFSDTELTSPIFYSSIYVFENYDPSASLSNSDGDYNQTFTLNVDTLLQSSNGTEIVVAVDIPAYNAAIFNGYPSASNPMEISGYMSTNWSSKTEGAEGIVMQVYDNGDHLTRTLAFAWFTYDDLGLPFWLYGQASLNIGATTVTATTVYFKGGTFAGNGGGGALKAWGTVNFKFPDCGHMNIVYNGDASADNGPKGNSSAQFSRVADVNGLVCQ
jgi:hypothetical protein